MSVEQDDQVLRDIAERASAALIADRCTIFQVDAAQKEVYSRVALGLEEQIRLPVGRGAIGFVARTGRPLRLRDAYNDPRFDPSVDQRTGYRTKSVLCVPVSNAQGTVLGAIQVINKTAGQFSADDELLLATFGDEVAAILVKAQGE
jgi:GAF domain-containing protein